MTAVTGHTPGKWADWGDDATGEGQIPFIEIGAGEIWTRDCKSIARVESTLDDSSGEFFLSEEDRDNARLIIAAVNSYDKHCGPRAVECAEGDLLGECLEALKLTTGALAYVHGEEWETVKKARAAIAKAQGDEA